MARDYRQYPRALSFIAGNMTGNAIDLSDLRITFQVQHGVAGQSPKTLEGRIYNPDKQTVARLHSEFSVVSLSAGYKSNSGPLFTGSIVQTRYVRDNPTDTYLALLATDADQAYSAGVVNQTLAAGWSHYDQGNALQQAVAEFDIRAAVMPQLPETTGSRPKVCYGMVRDLSRTMAKSTNTAWNLAEKTLSFHLLNGAVAEADNEQDQAYTLTPATGLLGMPQQVTGGVEANCLLNPKLKAGGRVIINMEDIIAARADTSYQAAANPNYIAGSSDQNNNEVSGAHYAGISPTGNYRILYVNHSGDTRGNDWSTQITCTAIDASAVLTTGQLRGQ